MNQDVTLLDPPAPTQKMITVQISDMQISKDPNAVLITHSLGSCLGLTVYDPIAIIGGMIHCMMPTITRATNPRDNRCRYVDTGVPLLLSQLIAQGLSKSRAQVYIAGCSSCLDKSGIFKIGQKNYTIFRKIIWKNNLLITSEDIGGSYYRTISLEIGSGRFIMKKG